MSNAVKVVIAPRVAGGAYEFPADQSVPTAFKPIIAELFAAPAAFADKPIEIYGLVIDSDRSHTRFQLQDVSQHPLTIVGNARLRAKIGDQLIVRGTLRWRGKDIYFVATSLIATRVLGGGGCC